MPAINADLDPSAAISSAPRRPASRCRTDRKFARNARHGRFIGLPFGRFGKVH